MSSPTGIVCLGDLMTELVLPVAAFPSVNRTSVVRGRPEEIGGTAFNICWHLAKWGLSPRLVSWYGRRQVELVKEAFLTASLDSSGLVSVQDETDRLLVFQNGNDHIAVYLLGELPPELLSRIESGFSDVRILVVTGSRHAELRQACTTAADAFSGWVLAFSPSYAVYEYEPECLQRMLIRADVTQLNEREAHYAAQSLGLGSVEGLAAHLSGPLLVTRASKGVRVFERESAYDIESFSHSSEDVIGAGDVFFAAVLYRLLYCKAIDAAVRFGVSAAARFVDAQPSRSRAVRIAVPTP